MTETALVFQLAFLATNLHLVSFFPAGDSKSKRQNLLSLTTPAVMGGNTVAVESAGTQRVAIMLCIEKSSGCSL